jgi:hypothetical protein
MYKLIRNAKKQRELYSKMREAAQRAPRKECEAAYLEL